MMKILTSLLEIVFLPGKSKKNRLEHAFAVMAWDLSLQPEIQVDCMDHLSNDTSHIRNLVDEVVSQLHYPFCPNKKGDKQKYW